MARDDRQGMPGECPAAGCVGLAVWPQSAGAAASRCKRAGVCRGLGAWRSVWSGRRNEISVLETENLFLRKPYRRDFPAQTPARAQLVGVTQNAGAFGMRRATARFSVSARHDLVLGLVRAVEPCDHPEAEALVWNRLDSAQTSALTRAKRLPKRMALPPAPSAGSACVTYLAFANRTGTRWLKR